MVDLDNRHFVYLILPLKELIIFKWCILETISLKYIFKFISKNNFLNIKIIHKGFFHRKASEKFQLRIILLSVNVFSKHICLRKISPIRLEKYHYFLLQNYLIEKCIIYFGKSKNVSLHFF